MGYCQMSQTCKFLLKNPNLLTSNSTETVDGYTKKKRKKGKTQFVVTIIYLVEEEGVTLLGKRSERLSREKERISDMGDGSE